MAWRGPTVLLALLALGLAGGYAASLALAQQPSTSGVAEPVVARNPRLPVDRETPTAPDPDDPALAPGVPLETVTMGSGKFRITFPVPQGWVMNSRAVNEAKWKQPGTSNNTYVLRVEQTRSQYQTIADTLDTVVTRLETEEDDVEILDRGTDSLEYTYVSNEGTARHSFVRWLDLTASGFAEVEVVVHGRERDVPGTRDLIDRVADSMRSG